MEKITPSAYTEIEMCRTGISRQIWAFHYFIRIPSLNIEIHPGFYTKGSILSIGRTKNYTIFSRTMQCDKCINKMLSLCDDTTATHAWFYPLINCETFTRGLCMGTPWSVQIIILCCAFLLCICFLCKFSIMTALFLSTIVFELITIYTVNKVDENSKISYYCGH